jgi:hypothetical protein
VKEREEEEEEREEGALRKFVEGLLMLRGCGEAVPPERGLEKREEGGVEPLLGTFLKTSRITDRKPWEEPGLAREAEGEGVEGDFQL